MTIMGVITLLQSVKPHQYSEDTVIHWISDLEGLLYREIVCGHEMPVDEVGYAVEIPHGPYDPEQDMDTVLMVPEPYSDVYVKYLAAQIDYHNAEFARYNNSMVMYNMALSALADWHNRNHMPLQNNYISI